MSKYKTRDYCGDENETETVLQALEDARVFCIRRNDPDGFTVREKCDECYDLVLTREMLIDLGNELIAMANNSPKLPENSPAK